MAFKVNLSEADKRKVAELNKEQKQKYISGNSSGLNNSIKLPEKESLNAIGNAQVRNNALLGLDLFNRGSAFGEGSRETERKYKEIAASPEIQELAKGQSYLKKELPQSGLMLGGDPVARNAAIRTGIKANATEEEREVQAAKDLIAAANSPVERFMQGFGRGLAPAPTTRFSWQEETPTEKMVSDLVNNTTSGVVGNLTGEALPYLMAYGKLGGVVGEAAMKLPGAAKLGNVGRGVLKSVAADVAIGAPLNANYVLNKEGLRGEEAAKEFAKQEALDFGIGIGMEFIGAAFKALRGKKLTSSADILNLSAGERAEIESYAERLQRLADESNARKGKNQIDNGVIEAWDADTFANQRGLPLPTRENPSFTPQKRELASTRNFRNANEAYEDAVNNLEAYIKNYEPKGTETSIVPIGDDMTGRGIRSTVSQNDKWYQDFYREYGRAPRKGEARELAMKLIDDDMGRPYGEFNSPELDAVMSRNMDTVGQGKPRTLKSYVDENIERPYTIDRERANRELPRTVTPGELMRERTSYISAENVAPQGRKAYNEYISSTDKEIKKFVEKVQSGSVSKKASKQMSEVSMSESLRIRDLMGKDVRGYHHRLHSNTVEHINQRHGIKGKADNSMADINDIARIDYVMRNADNIDVVRNTKGEPDTTTAFLNSDNSPAPLVRYEKRVDGHYYVVSAVPDNANKTIDVVSAYIKKADTNVSGSRLDGRMAKAPHQTPEAPTSIVPDSTTASNSSILPSAKKNVKKDLGADIDRTGTYAEYGKKYGTFEGTDVPKATPYGDVQKHISTIDRGGQYSEEAMNALKEIVEEGGASKLWKRNSVSIDDAAKKVSEGAEAAANDFSKKLGSKEKITSDDITLGYTLAKHFDEEGDYARAAEILGDVSEMLSETGRALQAANIALKNTPLGRQKTVSRMAKKVSEQSGIDIKLSDDVLERLSKAEEPNDIARAMEAARLDIMNQVPPTFEDKFNAWRYTSMLGNVKTVARNEIGNCFSNYLRQVKDFIGVPLEAALQKGGLIKQGQRTKAVIIPKKDKALIEGGRKSAKYFMEDLKGNAKYGDIFTTRPQEAAIFGTKNGPISKTVGKAAEGYRKLTNKALEDGIGHFKLGEREFAIIKGDAGWLEKVYSDAWAKVVKANRYTVDEVFSDSKLMYQVHELAKSEAQKATFRDMNKLSDALSRTSLNLRTKGGAAGKFFGYLLEGIVPFKRTTMNVLRRSIEYSPVGLAEGIGKFVKAARNGENLVPAIDRMCAGLTGTGVAGLGAYLSYNDILSVNVSSGKVGDFEKMQGEQPFSVNVKIGGKEYSYTLDWLAPAAIPLFAGASLMEGVKDDGFTWEDVFDAIDGMANPYFEMSMLQGVMNIFDAQSYGDSSGFTKMLKVGGNAGFSLMGQTIPTVLGQFARTIDPSNRRTNASDKEGAAKWAEYNFNKNVISKIPVVNQKREEYVDQWGRTSRKEDKSDYVVSAVVNFLSPGYVSEKKSSKAEKEISKLYEATGESSIIPSNETVRDVVSGNDKYLLTGTEQTQYKKTRGKEARERIEKLIETESYKNADNEHKTKMIAAEYEEANFQAKAEALVAHGVDEKDAYLDTDGLKTKYSRFEKYGGGISPKKARETFKTFDAEFKEAWRKSDGTDSAVSNGKAAMLLAVNNADDTMRIALDISKEQNDAAKKLVANGWTIEDIRECEEFCKSISFKDNDETYVTNDEILAWLKEYYPRLANTATAKEINKII